jgi:hypothetical protein
VCVWVLRVEIVCVTLLVPRIWRWLLDIVKFVHLCVCVCVCVCLCSRRLLASGRQENNVEINYISGKLGGI